jgi:hypothetical protein
VDYNDNNPYIGHFLETVTTSGNTPGGTTDIYGGKKLKQPLLINATAAEQEMWDQ